jgi:hypothetical protein
MKENNVDLMKFSKTDQKSFENWQCCWENSIFSIFLRRVLATKLRRERRENEIFESMIFITFNNEEFWSNANSFDNSQWDESEYVR